MFFHDNVCFARRTTVFSVVCIVHKLSPSKTHATRCLEKASRLCTRPKTQSFNEQSRHYREKTQSFIGYSVWIELCAVLRPVVGFVWSFRSWRWLGREILRTSNTPVSIWEYGTPFSDRQWADSSVCFDMIHLENGEKPHQKCLAFRGNHVRCEFCCIAFISRVSNMYRYEAKDAFFAWPRPSESSLDSNMMHL